MENFRLSTAQFENKSGDKIYNLQIIDKLSERAALEGAKAVAFHECSITGYTFARHMSKEQMLDLAELIPEGKSIRELTAIAKKI